jgi:pantoate--beta-alanine ligase
MEFFKQAGPLQAFLTDRRSKGSVVGLVPTMGALHPGHMSLVSASRKNGDFTVCSLFVNPTQFNDPEDLKKYPRNLDADKELLQRSGCDVLFAPEVGEMYEDNHQLRFEFGELGNILEGKLRPGHFSGVGLVVSKLFNIIRPSHAYFGYKDYQQFRIISLLNEEMKFGIQLHGLPTVREGDGLAMSSRNERLNPEERKTAPVLFRCLQQAREQLLRGVAWDKVHNEIASRLEKTEGLRLEYFALVNKFTLDNTFNTLTDGILLIAAYVGPVRLIDNLTVTE